MVRFRKGVLNMRNHLKRLLLVLCIITCAFGLTACGSSSNKNDSLTYDEKSVQSISDFVINGVLATFTEEQVDKFLELDAADIEKMFSEQIGIQVDGEGFKSGLDSWRSAKADLGDFGQITGTTVTANKDTITVKVAITGSKRNATVEILLNSKYKVTSCTTNVIYTLGEMMEKAALNTLLGMGTVFIVLILISLIIYLFSFMPKIEAAMKKKKEQTKTDVVDQTIAQIIEKEELSDDRELVAVISAAIAAYESGNGGTGDGYVVRTIRKRR